MRRWRKSQGLSRASPLLRGAAGPCPLQAKDLAPRVLPAIISPNLAKPNTCTELRTFAFILLIMQPVSALAASPDFIDRSAALPVSHVYGGGWEHFVGGGVAVFDCDGDGRLDLFAAGGAEPSHLLRNVTPAGGAITFEAVPLDLPDGVTGAWPLDVQGDGRIDLAVLRVGPDLLLRGIGGCRFGPAALGFESPDAWSTAFAATWEFGRALPTLVFGTYVDRADPEGPFGTCDASLLYRAEGRRYGPPLRLPTFCALSMLISDWRRSGRADLRVSNDRHYYVRDGYEQMIRLDTLAELGPEDGWPHVSLWGMGVASRDLTGDGRPEVMSTSMGDQLLQVWTEDGYVPAPYEWGTYAQRPFLGDDGRPSTGWHAEFGDIDNDGRDDLFIAKGNVDQMPTNAAKDPNNLLMQQADGRFVEAAAEAGVATVERARGAALADLNADGRLDLVVVNRRAPMELWQNVTSDAGGAVQVALRQPGGNSRAVGAWIELEAGGRTQWREVTVGGGHGGGTSGPAHFGIGDAEAARLRVSWPDGTRSGWITLPARFRGELRRQGDEMEAVPW